jgi:CubicO group peptidase (beta-lactamase class C family)
MRPTLIAPETATAMRTIQFPSLSGVLPGYGRMDPCPWGLGIEIRGFKDPHWIPPSWGSGAFGHFGQAGGFLAVDESRHLGVATLGDEPFGPWAIEAWPSLLNAVREQDSHEGAEA